jgi:ribosome-associated protein
VTIRFDIESLDPWIEVRFARSSGPGGQNVNKLNTRAELLFDFESCPSLSIPQRDRVRTRLSSRLSADGRLRVVAQQGRTQRENRNRAAQRLLELIGEALHTPRARTTTRPGRAAVRRRLADKQRRAAAKQLRRRPPASD